MKFVRVVYFTLWGKKYSEWKRGGRRDKGYKERKRKDKEEARKYLKK